MSARTCYWQNAGPTMRECMNRATLIGEVLAKTLGPEFATDVIQPPTRCTVIVRGMDFVGEYDLMTESEKAAGHWVHTDSHSGECPERG